MIAPQRLHPFKWRIPGMDSIMHASIHQVPEQKTGKKHKSVLPHDKKHDAENESGKNDTGYRRHKEPLPVPWVMMVITMKDV